LDQLSEIKLIQHTTGFGLYDRAFVEEIRRLNDPNLYTRGLVGELGFDCVTVPYRQKSRKKGITKNNFMSLYDTAMAGITSHSKLPLRLATLLGFGLSALSLIVAIGYLIYKLIFWRSFPVGVAPIVIGLFFALSVILFFLGVLGEYIAVIHTRVMRRPLILEKERINLEETEGAGVERKMVSGGPSDS
jgi:glycosyltransferase involved in cell wall biosynthesis